MGTGPNPVASAGAFPYEPPAEATARFCPWWYRDGGQPCATQARWPEVHLHRARPPKRRHRHGGAGLPKRVDA